MEKIFAIIIALILIIVAFFVVFQESVSSERIIDKFVESASNINTYKYRVHGSIMRYSEGVFSYGNGDPYVMEGQVDILNKAYTGWVNGNYINETLEKHPYELSYYVENNSYFGARDKNTTWICVTHNYHTNNVLNYGDSDDDYSEYWDSISLLERLASNVIRNASFKRLNDDNLDEIECFVIKINPETNNLYLRGLATDLLFPYRYSNQSYMDVFNDEYEAEIKYWVDKENYLLKKAYIKVNYTVEYTSKLNVSQKLCWIYENELSFYDYNTPLYIDRPWQHFIDQAKEELNNLNFIDLEMGYGFNPPSKWNNTNLTKSIFGVSNYSSNYYYWTVSRLEQLVTDSEIYNYTLKHGTITINNMEGYEFIYQYNESDIIVHEMGVKHHDRWLYITISGDIDEYNSQIMDIKLSLNTSLVIVSPYFQMQN